MAHATCSVEGCDRPRLTLAGLCKLHHTRWTRHGDPTTAKRSRHRTLADRFWAHARLPDDPWHDCWGWALVPRVHGYSSFVFNHVRHYAHRVSYELLVGPIPDGLELDHLCRNPGCCNPFHLEAVTHQENMLRGIGIAAINAKKTSCPNGHPYDTANTRITPRGTRACRQCKRDRNAT